jgi:hypothetical protein
VTAVTVVSVVSVLLLSSCTGRDDLSGMYVGEGKGTYRPKDGAPKDLTFPNDVVVVKRTARHYQYSEIEVTVRGCVLRSEGAGASVTSWSLSSGREGGTCFFDVPSVGAVTLSLRGGLEQRPSKQVHLSFYGSDNGELFGYSIDATPKR